MFEPPSSYAAPRKSAWLPRLGAGIETWLDAERDQLALWLPVALGAGIAAWFVLSGQAAWIAFISLCAGVGLCGLLLPTGLRMRRLVASAGLAGMLGCGLIWARALWVAAPVLTQPVVATFEAQVERVEVQTARERVRLTLVPVGAPVGQTELPPRVRVTVREGDSPDGLSEGARVRLRARLMPPPDASVPGGFDFRRVAWFQGLGATGRALGAVERLDQPDGDAPQTGFRERLSAHIRTRMEGSAGGIAAAFATGDRGGIAIEDEDAMRASGLTHLLSVSGLHVTAVIGAAMLLTLRLLALSSTLALRTPLLLIAALIGAATGIGYTVLTGAEVPTVRSCVAAVLVLIGIALGREAFTLRLVATGAGLILLVKPEALVGPSFQLSFAAITAIVALHDAPWMQRLSGRDIGWVAKLGRTLFGLLMTGLVVEVALAPIVLFHFHKSGFYGALANIIAIPLTTFVIMPLEALALLFDTVGLGAPFWWLTGQAMAFLLWLARSVAAVPGAQAALASVPMGAFALMIAGGLWLMLWRTRVRIAGLVPFAAGAFWALATPAPDLIITGDGMHLAVRGNDGTLATLRPRAGDYVRSVLGERAGEIDAMADLDAMPGAVCSVDACRVKLMRGGRGWQVLAIRSRYLLPPEQLKADCAAADIAVSDRRLPDWCAPRWFKADRVLLAETGGLAVDLTRGHVETVRAGEGAHPWVVGRMRDPAD
jgi:competence protein ComEC